MALNLKTNPPQYHAIHYSSSSSSNIIHYISSPPQIQFSHPILAMKKKSPTMGSRDSDLWLIRPKSGGRPKVTTRCVSDNNQYYKDNIINSNRTTTRSWPVICRQPKPYDEDDFETVFALNNNHNSNEDLSPSHKYFGHESTLQHTIPVPNHGPQSKDKMQPQTATGAGSCLTSPPPVVFLMITLVMTISATAMLCAAVMTDHWEVIRWDKDVIENRIVNNTHDRLYWFLNGRVAKISKLFL